VSGGKAHLSRVQFPMPTRTPDDIRPGLLRFTATLASLALQSGGLDDRQSGVMTEVLSRGSPKCTSFMVLGVPRDRN